MSTTQANQVFMVFPISFLVSDYSDGVDSIPHYVDKQPSDTHRDT